MGRSCFAVESAVAQICREGGAQVSLNAMLRDLDIVPLRTDGRRLEVVAEGLTLFGGCQLALDATVVSPLHGDATHRRRADVEDGVALREARRRKERTYPELCQGNGRARLVVIAGEVGGRWSDETKTFLWSLACAKADVSATDVRQCPSCLVQEVDMPLGLLFGEGGLFPSRQGGFSWRMWWLTPGFWCSARALVGDVTV